MNKTKKWWMPVLLACLLMATLVGMAGARPNARPHDASPGWKLLTVPVQSCIPAEETTDYKHEKDYLQCPGYTCLFFCPVNFPTEDRVTVQRLTLYVYDDDYAAAKDAHAILYKINPANKNTVELATVYTYDASSDDPQVRMDTSIHSPLIRPAQGAFLRVYVGSQNIRIYGFRIHYSR